MRKLAVIAALSILLSGCASHLLRDPIYNPNNPGNQPHILHSRSSLGQAGFTEQHTAEIQENCQGGTIESVEVQQDPLDLLLTMLTLGLYSPADIAYFCGIPDREGQ